MNYTIGRQGRIVVAKLSDGEDILTSLKEITTRENIRSAFFFLIGGMKEGRFVAGPMNDSIPPVPMWRELGESHEIFGTGTIFREKDIPKIHFHGAYARGDNIKAGCLRENARVFLIIEAIIIEIEGINAVRRFDEKTGLTLLDF
ncbi:hypothetical protein BMS3Abin07_02086 [bacterium BMS3Abin07]|nr:hypothetical protein BMS3Abin07_02086 [bacterium BMS3Abin07]GBE32573.1 hypothetical protein BMS3Bbin05_01489 [bacterium BMS3Bbin05]HDO22907.1 DNA-binding protein [Nitrospirota bacterium]